MNADDPASVLEQFIHNVANLPAEINHLYQEIEANDKLIQKYRATNHELDSNIQKLIKATGVGPKTAKEEEDSKQVLENFDRCAVLQAENVTLSERAELLLERHIRKLDKKIRDMQNDGSMSVDHQLPSLLRDSPGNIVPLPEQRHLGLPTRASSRTSGTGGAAADAAGSGAAAVGAGSAPAPALGHAGPGRSGRPLANQAQTALSNALGNAVGSSRTRESSASDGKRRRGGGSAQPTGPAATALGLNSGNGSGPATARTSASSSRAGSTGPVSRPGKKAGMAGPRKNSNAQLIDRTWSAASASPAGPGSVGPPSRNKKTGKLGPERSGIRTGGLAKQSPGPASTAATGPTSTTGPTTTTIADDDSYMSELDGSDEDDDSQLDDTPARIRIRSGPDSDRMDVDDDEGDDTKYCLCQNVSYGDMVMCDNANCRYQWFHWACIGMDKEPEGDWLCPVCTKMSPARLLRAQ